MIRQSCCSRRVSSFISSGSPQRTFLSCAARIWLRSDLEVTRDVDIPLRVPETLVPDPDGRKRRTGNREDEEGKVTHEAIKVCPDIYSD